MKPKKYTKSVTLEGRKDRRYARTAAKRMRNDAMLANIKSEEDIAWRRLFTARYVTVTSDDISSAWTWGLLMQHKFTEFKSDEGIRQEIAQDYANDHVGQTATTLPEAYVRPLAGGLLDIVNGGKFRAALSFTRVSTARQMILDISPLKDDMHIPEITLVSERN